MPFSPLCHELFSPSEHVIVQKSPLHRGVSQEVAKVFHVSNDRNYVWLNFC